MRLIDTDALLSMVKPIVEDDAFRACTIETTKKIIYNLITDAPTIDAVPVVRCKDCSRQCICYHSADYYCADGEKVTE